MLCWHPRHVPVAIGIHRATDVSFMHPASRERSTRPLTCTEQSGQQALLFIRNRVPVILVASPDCVPSTCTPTSRLSNNLHSTEWPAGRLIHSKSRPSDSCYLPSLASQRPSPPASQRRALATTCTQQTGRQALSFIQNRVPVNAITYTLRHSDIASQQLSTSQRRIPVIAVASIPYRIPAANEPLHPFRTASQQSSPSRSRHPTDHYHPHISCCIPATIYTQ